MASSKLIMVVAVIAIASLCVPSTVAQTRHVVGDAFGWRVPTDGNANYTNWASRQTFNVGDTLFFNFTTGSHDVTEVSQIAYGPCNATAPISRNPNGPTTLNLTTAGNHYYICTVGPHCQLGQKLMITVAGSSSTTPTGSMTPPPPSPSGSSSLTTVLPVTFLAAALALLY